MIDTIILMTGPVEEVALTEVLRRHNEDLTIHPVRTQEQLETLDPAAVRRARLIGFVTPVVVPPHILNALGFGAYNFHPGPPNYPGWIPAHFAIYDKATTFGATAHRMAEQVDAGPIIDVELFDIPPGINVTRLQEMAFTQVARLFWRLAPVLAIQSAPLAALPIKWTGTKSTKRMHKAICDLPPDIAPQELQRRIEAFGAGDFGVELTITLHGHKFRYAAPEPQSKAEPPMREPAMLVA
jgi:methionyl-tRNA formyltransferase